MFRWCRKKSLRIPRLAMMLVLASGLLAQSLIDLSGQTHDAVLHADAGQAYTPHQAPHEHDAPDAGDAAHDDDGALHVLMHQPCAGHCFWMTGAHIALLPGEVLATRVGLDIYGPIRSADFAAPFRPPIRA
jgi:hypothetical protein